MRHLTSEKSILNVESTYHLVIMASRRAAKLTEGARPTIPVVRNRKPALIALEEIEKGTIKFINENAPNVESK